MIEKLCLALGNIVSMYKTLNIQLPDEVQSFVEDNLFLLFFSYLNINSHIHNRFISFSVAACFQLFIYKDRVLAYLKKKKFVKF